MSKWYRRIRQAKQLLGRRRVLGYELGILVGNLPRVDSLEKLRSLESRWLSLVLLRK